MKHLSKLTTASLSLLALLTFLLPPTPTSAEEPTEKSSNLQISPTARRLSLFPGDERDYEVVIKNIGTTPLTIKVSAAPYQALGATTPDFTDMTSQTQIARWITFTNETNFTLIPNDQRIVTYHISVPTDVAHGGQSAVIFAEGKPSQSSSTGITTTIRLASTLYASIPGDTRESVKITDTQFPRFFFDDAIAISSKIINSGNTDVESRHYITINQLFGEKVYENSQLYSAAANQTEIFSLGWKDTPPFGIFKVTYTVLAAGNKHSQSHIVLVAPLAVAITTLVILSLALILTLFLIYKKLSNPPKPSLPTPIKQKSQKNS
jgi:hypothetical protein